MKEILSQLNQRTGDELCLEAREVGRKLSGAEWHLAALLLAMERSGVHHSKGFSSMVRYAVQELGLDAHKASELLRVARALVNLPLLSRAFQEGHLSWAKIRAVTRVATPETEADWLRYALENVSDAIEAEVVQSPRRWRQEEEKKRAPQVVPCTEGKQLQLDAPAPPETRGSESKETPAPPDSLRFETQETPSQSEIQQPEPEGSPASGPGRVGSSSARRSEALPPPGDRRIAETFHFTPEEFAEFDSLMRSKRAQMGRASRTQILLACLRSAGERAPKHPRRTPNTMLMLHLDAKTGDAWMDTDSGRVPAPPSMIEVALVAGNVAVTDAPDANNNVPQTVEDQPQGEKPSRAEQPVSSENVTRRPAQATAQDVPLEGQLLLQPKSSQKKHRPSLSIALLEALFVRAGGRCENPQCRRRGPLHVDHTVPRSVNPVDAFDDLQLLCPSCHSLKHRQDFDSKPEWVAARERAIEGRQEKAIR